MSGINNLRHPHQGPSAPAATLTFTDNSENRNTVRPFVSNTQEKLYENPHAQHAALSFAFVTSRHTDQDNDMYDRWKDYHERMLRPAYGEDIETAITPDLYDALYEQVKARVLAYIP